MKILLTIALFLSATHVNAELLQVLSPPKLETFFEHEICHEGCDIYYQYGTQVFEDPLTGVTYIRQTDGTFIKY